MIFRWVTVRYTSRHLQRFDFGWYHQGLQLQGLLSEARAFIYTNLLLLTAGLGDPYVNIATFSVYIQV